MSVLTIEELGALLAAGCRACHSHSVRARAIYPARVRFLDGEPVSSPSWRLDGARFPDRIYRVECADCCNAAFERDDCPLCRTPAGLARALAAPHGLTRDAKTLPANCPTCSLGELDLNVEIRMHTLYVNGSVARRVADAEPHDPAYHVTEASCPDCEEIVAKAPEIRCAMCGRSALLKRP